MRPLELVDGYLPLEDYGLIGDGSTAALVGRDGSIDWLCVPRFDSPALFCSLLDRERGGRFRIAPEDVVEAEQRYDGDTAVLITELASRTGVVRITDALALRAGAHLEEDVPAGRGELVRIVTVLDGTVRLRVDVEPRDGADAESFASGLRLRCRSRTDLDLHLGGTLPLEGLSSTHELAAGERAHVTLRWAGGSVRHHVLDSDALLEQTLAGWRRWMESLRYQGPQEALVRRSALTLKLLDHVPNGAIVAAPTSSLPEAIGGGRNWDYRYAWIRDAAFSVYALRRIGLEQEAWSFLSWVLEAIEGEERPCVLYDVDGRPTAEEREDPDLEGYRDSRPVRWGNAAGGQRQHDVFGEILDCAFQWVSGGRGVDPHLWDRLSRLAEAAEREWREPDHGIWEVRTSGRPFTYSAALCQVALDRGARIGERLGLPCDVEAWRRESTKIRRAVLEDAWDEEAKSLTEHLGGGALDASLLALPLRRVLPADHPRMVATTAAVAERLGAGGGLVHRYHPDESPDGLEGEEGAFLLCSFWLADNLALQGRVDEAGGLFESLCRRANPLGLLAEQVDPGTGAFLGNFPQAFSHVGLISTAVTLVRASGESPAGREVSPAAGGGR